MAISSNRRPAEPLTAAEVDALLRGCSQRAPTGLRNRALIVVMYRAGLRVSEAVDLRASDVDYGKGTIRVRDGKGHKPRTVAVDDGALVVVARWADRRRALGFTRGPLLCTLKGTRMSPRYAGALLHRLGAKAGIDKRVHPHGLRHTHAAELAAEGVPINVISKQLGHAGSGVTARYIDHLAPIDVMAMGRARRWQEPEKREPLAGNAERR